MVLYSSWASLEVYLLSSLPEMEPLAMETTVAAPLAWVELEGPFCLPPSIGEMALQHDVPLILNGLLSRKELHCQLPSRMNGAQKYGCA